MSISIYNIYKAQFISSRFLEHRYVKQYATAMEYYLSVS